MKTQNRWWAATVILAFAAFICACQIDSAHADKYHLNGFYWVATIVLGAIAVFCGYKVATYSPNGRDGGGRL